MAQFGSARLLGVQEVGGSNPLPPTNHLVSGECTKYDVAFAYDLRDDELAGRLTPNDVKGGNVVSPLNVPPFLKGMRGLSRSFGTGIHD